jgi:hypothetical protein
VSICPGGLTQPKAGIAPFVNYASSAAGLLSTIPKLAKLGPLAYALSAVSIATTQLCASEPPAMPTFTQDEINAVLNNNFFSPDYKAGLEKLRDMVTILAWYDLCECQSGGAVTLPTPPTQPDLPAAPPTNISASQGICKTVNGGTANWTPSSSGVVNADVTGFGFSLTNPPVIFNPISATFTITTAPHTGGSGNGTFWQLHAFTIGAGTTKTLSSWTMLPTDTHVQTVEFDPNFPIIGLSGDLLTFTTPGEDVTISYQTICRSGPSLGASDCCPPDPILAAKIDNIQALVTLLQRQLAPFSYIMGATHVGLTGAGVLDVQGLLGAKIEITTDPTTLGIEGSSPTELFDRGWITWGTPDGYPQSERLQHNPQLSLPARASAFTELAYDLHPGVEVTITEIVREA